MKNWIAQRYKLLTKIKKRIAASYGGDSISLRKYSRHLRVFFESSTFRKTDERHFLEALTNDKIQIIVGTDFHSYIQNQKAHARILRKLNRQVVLALECFRSTDQPYIDQYLKAQITEESFLSKIGWNENWGFPWKNYKLLLDLAIEKRWKVIGINRATRNKAAQDLLKRDQWMAQAIVDSISPQHLVYVIVGELHAAPACLPAELCNLRASTQMLSLFVNPDPLLEASGHRSIHSSQFYRISRTQFALVNSSALAKWQTYLMFLESQDHSLDEEFFELDVSEHVHELAKILTARIGVDAPCRDLTVYTAWEDVPREKRRMLGLELNKEMNLAKKLGEVCFAGSVGVSHSLNFNHLCELAGYSFLPPLDWSHAPQLEQRIWTHLWSYFYSKILNPHRKSRSLEELLKSKKISYGSQLKVLAYTMSLRISALRRDHQRYIRQSTLLRMSANEKFLTALLLGELYGGFLFDWHTENQLPIQYLYELSQQKMDDENFLMIFLDFLAQVMDSNIERQQLQVVV